LGVLTAALRFGHHRYVVGFMTGGGINFALNDNVSLGAFDAGSGCISACITSAMCASPAGLELLVQQAPPRRRRRLLLRWRRRRRRHHLSPSGRSSCAV